MGMTTASLPLEHADHRTPLELLAYWINERERIHIRKEVHQQPPPWTDDPILRAYRFCNVSREDDRVTRWIAKYWREPHAKDPYLWHAMLIARYLNWPNTLAMLPYPEPWPDHAHEINRILLAREATGTKVFTGAYIVSTNGAKMSKVRYVLKLFGYAWKHQGPRVGSTLAHAHTNLMLINGVGSFMAAQIVADLKYTPFLKEATDWHTWAAPGPGSLRGLSRVRGLGTGSKWRKDAFVPELLQLRKELQPLVEPSTYKLLHDLQNLQNCLCEYDKFCRALYDQGRPKARYTSHAHL